MMKWSKIDYCPICAAWASSSAKLNNPCCVMVYDIR